MKTTYLKQGIAETVFRAVVGYGLSAVILIALFAPFLLLFTIRKFFTGKDIFKKEQFLGKYGATTGCVEFNTARRVIKSLPLLLLVFTGKARLVGLCRKSINFQRQAGDEWLFADKPGLISLYFLRDSTKITHKSLIEIETEYIENKSLKYDFLLVIRCIPAIFYSTAGLSFCDKVNLLGVEFDNISMKSAVNLIKNTIIEKKERLICFVNPDCLNKTFTDKDYYDILCKSDNVFPDGIGINIACKIIKSPMRENINGTDMLPYLCELCEANGWGMYFLGAKPGVAAKMCEKLKQKYPQLLISGCDDGYFDRSKTDELTAKISSSGAKILFVAFGVPLQEKWIWQNRDKLKVPVVLGVGGLFDFYSGNIKRAPIWLREIGGEWIYRIMQEPKRMWKRYIVGNPVFLYRVIRWNKRGLR